jgi:hypothetical protein
MLRSRRALFKQATGRLEGVMALIKKIDVNDHFAARRKMRLAARGLMRQPAATAPLGPEAAGREANASGFEKDLSLEHSVLKLPEATSK